MTIVNTARADLLREAPLDCWIALSKDETTIVAIGATFGEAANNSERAGVEDPVILKTPKIWLPLSV